MRAEFNPEVNEKFQNKTIAKVETTGVNVWVFWFTDGTKQEVYAECAGGAVRHSLPRATTSMTQKQLTLDEFLDVEFYRGHSYQTIVVLIDEKEHVVKDWWPESDAVVDLGNPDLRETCNHRIVLEI